MLSERRIREELRAVARMKNLALRAHDQPTEDWLYGAEVALSWALGDDTMNPYKAFYPAGSDAVGARR